jgi:hypothetical protein
LKLERDHEINLLFPAVGVPLVQYYWPMVPGWTP